MQLLERYVAALLLALSLFWIEIRLAGVSTGLWGWLLLASLCLVWPPWPRREGPRSTNDFARGHRRATVLVWVLVVLAWLGLAVLLSWHQLQAGRTPRLVSVLLAAWIGVAPLGLCGLGLLEILRRRRAGTRILVAGLLLFGLPLALGLSFLSLNLHRVRVRAPTSSHEGSVGSGVEGDRLDGARILEFYGSNAVRLHAVWEPHPEPRALVIAVHGIGADHRSARTAAAPLRPLGFSVLSYDQRGHGRSGGWTTTLGLLEAEDLVRVSEQVRQQLGTRSLPVFVLGMSMGGAAAQLAAPRLEGLRGLILMSTFADSSVAAGERLPTLLRSVVPVFAALHLDYLACGHRVLDFQPVLSAPRTSCPVLVLHAADDTKVHVPHAELISRHHGRRAQLVVLPHGGHALLHEADAETYAAALQVFCAPLLSR